MRRALGAFGAIGLAAAVSGCGGGSATSGAQTGPDQAAGAPATAPIENAPARVEPPPPPPPPAAKTYAPKYERKPTAVSSRRLPTTTRTTRVRAPRIYAGLDDVLRLARPLRHFGKTALADKQAELKKYLADQKKAKKKRRKRKRRVKRRRRNKKPDPAKIARDKALEEARKKGVAGAFAVMMKEKRISLLHDIATIRFHTYRSARRDEVKLLESIRTTRSYYARSRLRVALQKKMEESKKLQAAAELGYAKLLADKELRKYSRLDEVLFDYGLLFHLSGQSDKTKPLWKRLLEQAADSRLAPLVRLALAERAFDKNAMAEAESLYEEASKKAPRAGLVAAYLAYKQGWVQLRLNRQDKAMKSFYDAYRHSRYRRTLRKLNGSAMRGYVRAFAASGELDKAYGIFRRLDYRRAFEMVQLLSDLYRSQGKAKEALALAKEMLRRQSDHVLACSWKLDVTLDAMRAGDRKSQLAALDEWIKLYVSQRDRYGLIPPTEISDCHNAAQRIATAIVRSMHLEAQKSGSESDRKATIAMYKKYLSIWPKAADAAEMRFYLADLRWRRAAKPTPVDKAIELWTKLTRTYDEMIEGSSYFIRHRARTAGAIAHANLAAIYADPALGKSNKKQALDHYKKACDYKHKPSCEEADRLSGKKKALPPPAPAAPAAKGAKP